MKSREVVGYILAVLWAFFTGYVIALNMGVMSMSWGDGYVTLWFPQGGMPSSMFVSLFRIAQWSSIILTFTLLLYILVSLMEAQ